MAARVDIVIVNWNSGHYLAECLESIRTFGGSALCKIVIVDNGSTDDSLNIDTHDQPLEIMRVGANLGFAKACNVAALKCNSPYILFLNPDARLMENALDRALAFMESGAAAHTGICGVRLIDGNGETQRHCARFPVWRTFVGRAMGLEGKFPKLFPSNFMWEFDHLTSRTVDDVIGAFFLVRRNVFLQLAGFDERFFVYFEEVDFSLRARQAGWSTWYLADAVAFHKGGGSSERVKATRLFYSLRSRILYAIKHFSRSEALAVIGFTLCVEPIARLLRALLRASGQEARDTLRGYVRVWKGMPALLRLSRGEGASSRYHRTVSSREK